jgi:hypothetical protein
MIPVQAWWCIFVILMIWESEEDLSPVQSHPGKIFSYLKNKLKTKDWFK